MSDITPERMEAKAKRKTVVAEVRDSSIGEPKPMFEDDSSVGEANPVGRPSLYTQELADRICEELALGYSMRTVCAADDIPSMQTVFSWLRTKPEFLEQYARAKQESADAMAEDILDIADDGINDWQEMFDKDGDSIGWKVNGEVLQRSKLRVDTRKWLMSKHKPKKYGDKLDITTDGDKLPTPILGGLSVSKDDSSK